MGQFFWRLLPALLVLLAVVFLRWWWKEPKEVYMRGSRLTPPPGMEKADEGHPYLLGQRFHSFSELRKSVLIVGSPGSGKTVQIILLMKTVIGEFLKGKPVRMVIYDSKRDLLSRIRSMGVPEERLRILNPLDARCSAWAIAQDVRTAAEAQDLATTLVPLEPGSKQPYFPEAAQRVLAGIIEAFQQRALGKWELRDVILAAKTTERLAFLFQGTPSTEAIVEHFEPETTFRNVKSTLTQNLDKLAAVAASWHRAQRAGRCFSIRDWIAGGIVAVLGNSPKEKAALRVVNNLLLTQISKHLLSLPGEPAEHSFFFLDEFRELGRIDTMADWAATGRSKGSALILGFQDVFGVDEVYGEKSAREILGCCANIGILHINSSQPKTQEWASEVLGDHEFIREQESENISHHGQYQTRAVGRQFTHHTEKLWFPALFGIELPPTSLENGCRGLFRFENRFYMTNIPGRMLFTNEGKHHRVPLPHPDFPDEMPLEADQLILGDWTEADFARLGISGLREVATIRPKLNLQVEGRIQEALSTNQPTAQPEPPPQQQRQRISLDELG